ncbi:protein DEHYDRATION-INDUCED 19 homolog 2-like isoform X2 [Ananas comosus]|uniref:Protein DEHYDRATION-INDUCED 19 homolog 2-like isoform X2 n=1 Tax=Ananas comosus TaxID=4615 RepID=A0A6P5G510_ANACO|nr:protein DEHYDRATION-INDUCED 19 homolog 2-like isoform X2 [Ananas comosus]
MPIPGAASPPPPRRGASNRDTRSEAVAATTRRRENSTAPSAARILILWGFVATSMTSTPSRLKMGYVPFVLRGLGRTWPGTWLCSMGVTSRQTTINLIFSLTENHVHRRRRFRKAPSGTHSIFSLLRKDLRDGNLQSLFGGSSYMAAPPTAAPDPFLSSLIYTLPMTESKDSQSENLDCEIPVNRSLDGKTVERVEPSLSDKDQKERAQRSEFVKELVLSTIFNDPL